jgi:hypothetical protein
VAPACITCFVSSCTAQALPSDHACLCACAILCAVFVSPSLIEQTDAAVDETLRNSSWLDVATVLPPSLGPADVAQLLDKCADLPSGSDNKRGQVGNGAHRGAVRCQQLLHCLQVSCACMIARRSARGLSCRINRVVSGKGAQGCRQTSSPRVQLATLSCKSAR